MGAAPSGPLPGVAEEHQDHPLVRLKIGRVPEVLSDYRTSHHEIVPRVFLGDIRASCDHEKLRDSCITHVVNTLGSSAVRGRHFGIRYLTFEVDDVLHAQVAPFFLATATWMAAVLDAHPEHRILVHCAAGISRSSSMVIAYLMHAQRLRVTEAYQLVQAKRTIVQPNQSFRSQLCSWDEHLFAEAPWPHPAEAVPGLCADAVTVSPMIDPAGLYTWPTPAKADVPTPLQVADRAGGAGCAERGACTAGCDDTPAAASSIALDGGAAAMPLPASGTGWLGAGSGPVLPSLGFV